jgi:hypothetical protein
VQDVAIKSCGAKALLLAGISCRAWQLRNHSTARHVLKSTHVE